MPTIEIVVGLGLAAALLAALAQAIGVHYAIVLVLGGLVLDFIPGVPDLRVRPDLVLFVFLPRSSTPRRSEPRRRTCPIMPGGSRCSPSASSWSPCSASAASCTCSAASAGGSSMVLGAILGPTDPVAATAVLRRLEAPDRISPSSRARR